MSIRLLGNAFKVPATKILHEGALSPGTTMCNRSKAAAELAACGTVLMAPRANLDHDRHQLNGLFREAYDALLFARRILIANDHSQINQLFQSIRKDV
jgi:hypothetical protein